MDKPTESPEVTALSALAHTLAAAHDADTLVGALSVQLCNAGRWLTAHEESEHLCPESFAAPLVARLCVEGRGELAQALVTLLRGDGLPERLQEHGPDDGLLEDWIGDPPNRHLMRWLWEIAGPMIDVEPFAHGLVKGLREHDREELAGAVAALLTASGFSDRLLRPDLAVPATGATAPDVQADKPASSGVAEQGIAPLLPLRDVVIFPHTASVLFVGRERSIAALEEAMKRGKEILLCAQRDPRTRRPTPETIHAVGSVGVITEMRRLSDGTVKAVVEGRRRAQIVRFLESDAFFRVEYHDLAEGEDVAGVEVEARMRSVKASFERYLERKGKTEPEVLRCVQAIGDPGRLADTIAANLPVTVRLADRQGLLETVEVEKRLERLLALMQVEETPYGGEPDQAESVIPEIEDTLATAHGAEVLTRALIVRLCADGREVSAAQLMNHGVQDATGPIVDPGHLSAALAGRLRADGLGELADAFVTLIGDAGIAEGHDDQVLPAPALEGRFGALPSRAMLRWLMAVEGPGRALWHAQVLLRVFLRRLRADGHGELADAVRALLHDAVETLTRESMSAPQEAGAPGPKAGEVAASRGVTP